MTIEAESGERLYTWRYAPPFIRPPHPIPGRHMKILGLVGVATLLAGYDIQVFGLVAKQMLAEFGRSTADTGPTIALFRLGIVGALAMCLLADVIGRRRLLLITVAGMAVGTLLTAVAPTYETAVGAQLVVRVFGYTDDMLCIVVVAEEFEQRSRGWAIGALGALSALGAGLGYIIFAAVDLLPYGWRGLYAIGAIPLILLAWLRRGLPETRRFEEMKAEAGERNPLTAMWAQLPALLRGYPKRLAILLGMVFIYAFGQAPAISLMPTYMQSESGFAPWMVTATIVGTGLLGLIGSIIIGRLSDRVGRRPTLAVGMAFTTAGFAVLFSGGPMWTVIAGVFFGVFAQIAVNVQVDAVTAELFPTAYRATASGLRYLASIVGGGISLLLHGLVLTPAFGFGGALLVLLIPLPFAIVGVFFLPETASRRLEDIAPLVPIDPH